MLRLFIRPIDGLWPFAQLSPRSGHALLWRSLLSALKTSFAASAAQARFRRAERQLEALDQRLLQDIGIGRSEIGSAVRHGRRRSPKHARYCLGPAASGGRGARPSGLPISRAGSG